MPRKSKTKSQPLGELLGVRMPEGDRQSFLSVLDGLPPIVYWAQCRTDDQKEHYIAMKQGYQFLKEELQRYFGGQGSLIPRLSDRDRDFFCALRDRYLAWYKVVQLGWVHIEDELAEAGLTTRDIQAGSPGEALIRILENECAGFMQPSFLPYTRYSPSQERTLAKMQVEIARGDADQKAIARYEIQVAQNSRETKRFFELTAAMVDTCEKYSDRTKGLATAIKHYRQAVGHLDREIQRQHSTRCKRKGYEWAEGKKRELTRG